MVKVRVTSGFATGREAVVVREYNEHASALRFDPPLEEDVIDGVEDAQYFYAVSEYEVIDSGV